MSRSMKIGLTTIVAAFVVTMLVPEDAEARYRRFRGRRAVSYGYSGGCCGVPQTCCGVVAAPVCNTGCGVGACGVATGGCATGACGVATSAPVGSIGCPTGACTIAGGDIYSGGHSAAYGHSVQGTIQHQHQPTLPPAPQGTFDQSAPPAPGVNGGATGAQPGTPSPSDQPPPAPAAGDTDRSTSAPPPPPQDQ